MATIRIADVLAGIDAYPVDIYLQYKQALNSPEAKELGVDVLLDALHNTLRKFKIQEKNWEAIGSVVLRISHWLGDADVFPLSLDTEGEDEQVERFVHLAFDLYEDYNRRVAADLGGPKAVKDGQHKWNSRWRR